MGVPKQPLRCTGALRGKGSAKKSFYFSVKNRKVFSKFCIGSSEVNLCHGRNHITKDLPQRGVMERDDIEALKTSRFGFGPRLASNHWESLSKSLNHSGPQRPYLKNEELRLDNLWNYV